MRLDHCLEGRPPSRKSPPSHGNHHVCSLSRDRCHDRGPIARHSSLRRASASCRPSRRQSPNAMQTRGAVHVLCKEPYLRQTNSKASSEVVIASVTRRKHCRGDKVGATFTATGSWRVHAASSTNSHPPTPTLFAPCRSSTRVSCFDFLVLHVRGRDFQ